MMKYVFITFLLLIGCSEYRDMNYDPSLVPYVKKFESTYKLKVKVPVKYAELEGDIAGLCRIWENDKREIFIDIDYKNEEYDYELEELIFHEFGHCVFNLEHDTREKVETEYWYGIPYKSYYPKSIMYPYVFGASIYYQNHLQYYYDELTEKANITLNKKKTNVKIKTPFIDYY